MSGKPELTPLDKIIGANAKRLREERGVGQEDMAEILGCSVSLVSMLESGSRVWKTRWIYAYSTHFNIDASTLLAGPKSKADKATADMIKALEDAQNLIKSLSPPEPKSKK